MLKRANKLQVFILSVQIQPLTPLLEAVTLTIIKLEAGVVIGLGNTEW